MDTTLTTQYHRVEPVATVNLPKTAPQQVKSSAGSQPAVKTLPSSNSFFLQADAPSKDVGFNAAKRHFVGFIRYVSNCFALDSGSKGVHDDLFTYAKDKEKIAQLKKQLATNVNINSADSNGKTAIMHAAENGNLQAIHTLIAAGSGLNMPDKDGNTALSLAAKNGHAEVMRSLLQWGAKIEITDSKALILAAENGKKEAVEELLRENIYTDPKGKHRLDALEYACKNNQAGAIDALFSKTICENLSVKDACTVLNIAIKHNSEKVVEKLLSNGIGIDRKNENGTTALMYAIEGGMTKLLGCSLKKGRRSGYIIIKNSPP